MIAPILIFIYNRPEYLEKTLESLALNPLVSESTFYFFADGPKKMLVLMILIKFRLLDK